jgi:signal transduction histidine kinase
MLDSTFVTITITVLLITLVLGFLLGYLGHSLIAGRRSGKGKIQHKTGQEQHEHTRMVYRLVSALSSTLNYQRVLETTLDMGIEAFTVPDDCSDQLVCAFLSFAEDESESGGTNLKVGSARRFTDADQRLTLAGKKGLIAKAIKEGEGQLSKEITQDPELGQIKALRACKAIYCIPLQAGLETHGVLLFAHPNPACFTTDRIELLDIIGNQGMIAIQNASLYSDLEQEKEHLLEVQEKTRNKLARDLHDGPTQSVSAIAMQVNDTRRLMQQDPTAAAEELAKIEDLARRTTEEIRHMLFTLRPLVLESQGLVDALQVMANKMRETYEQNVIIEVQESIVQQMDLGKQNVAFFIAEQAINNACKHAHAPHIWVRLKQIKPGLALLEIQDDGVGFNISDVDNDDAQRGSLGMANMRARAEFVNGVFHIDSAEGSGTRVQVAIPLTEDVAERLRNRNL